MKKYKFFAIVLALLLVTVFAPCAASAEEAAPTKSTSSENDDYTEPIDPDMMVDADSYPGETGGDWDGDMDDVDDADDAEADSDTDSVGAGVQTADGQAPVAWILALSAASAAAVLCRKKIAD